MRKILLFDGLVEIGISDIHDGSMRFFGEGDEEKIIKRQNDLAKLIELDGKMVARVRTVYEGRDEYTDYDEITDDNLSEYSIENSEKTILISDGLITRRKDVGLLLPLADCIGAVVFDTKKQILGLLHAGRHNVEQYGPKEFIEYLCDRFGCVPSDLKVYFSPCAQNYKIRALGNKKMTDAAYEQLINMGVKPENIEQSGIDTVTDKNYPSASGGDLIDRFAVIVRLAK